MLESLTTPRQTPAGRQGQWAKKYRFKSVMATLATALMLAACGGGDDSDLGGDFNIGVTVGGQFVSRTPVAPGGSLNLAIRAGESLVVDAGESVVWTLRVGGTAVSGGAQVLFAGANIVATPVSQSAIAVDTRADFRLPAPVPITLFATSTFDSFQVVTVNLLITN